MYVDSTLMSDVKNVLGKCQNDEMFRRMTDAIRLANNQSKGNDWNIGQMDICVCDGCVTLPADVGTVMGVNNGGFPTLLRDQWFQYHVNGPGTQFSEPWGYTDELGPVVTYRDPHHPVKLVAITENPQDGSAAELRVYGWDSDGKRIYTAGTGGILEDGFIVPTIYGFVNVNPNAPAIARIDKIHKNPTNGFIRLVAVDQNDTSKSVAQIGYYLPWETTPSYRRLRAPNRSWLRIKYRKKDLEVKGLGDWINIENREALLLLLKAVKFRFDNQIEQAKSYETEGMRLLSNESESLRPPGISAPQVIFSDGKGGAEYLRDDLWLHY